MSEQLAEDEGQQEVYHADYHQRLYRQVGRALDKQVLRHKIADEEGRGQRGVLDYHDKLVAEGGEYGLERLRHDDVPEALRLAQSEAARRLALPRVNGLDAGADDLGDVGRAVAHERDGDAQELLLVERGDKLRQCKIEEVEL